MSVDLLSASRVLPAREWSSIEDYVTAGGGAGLSAAKRVAADVVIAELDASGLRGRGGAGFPTGAKWRTILSYGSSVLSTPVVVNAAEGEPGTLKDRTILSMNPYAVIEGALIAATVAGGRQITFAIKARFEDALSRLRVAIAEVERLGWSNGIEMRVFEGPDEYLYGEETALMEVLDGRPPFPRIAPPWRRGIVDVVNDGADVDSASGQAADVEMATTDPANVTPPVLINNVETFANIPAIVAKGAAWFRELGTPESPGTVVCTVSGAVRRPQVVEVPMGTSLRELLDAAGGAVEGRAIVGVLMGVSNAMITADRLDVQIAYETMAAHGTGLGSASFIVVDDAAHPVAVAAGVSRFLAVESCGQCTPCKQDGLEIAGLLAGIAAGEGTPDALGVIEHRLTTITDGARCNLAAQHQTVVGSVLAGFSAAVQAQADSTDPVEPYLVAETIALDGPLTVLDEAFAGKQPDWTDGPDDSGQSPAERLGEHRAEET